MDLQIISFTILLLTFFLFAFMVLKTLTKRAKIIKSSSKLPPGPRNLPIIGSLHHLVGHLSHRKLRELANIYGPIMYIEYGQFPTIIISSPDQAREIMSTLDVNFASRPRTFASRILVYNFDAILFSPYGDFWRNLRRVIVRDLMSAKRVQYSFKPIVEEETFNLVEWIASDVGSTINLTERFKSSFRRIIYRFAFGVKSKDFNDNDNNNNYDKFKNIIDETRLLASSFKLPDYFPSLEFLSRAKAKSERLRQKGEKILESIISEHREKKSCESEQDLVDILLKLHEDSDIDGFSLTMENIKGLLWDIISVGSNTSIVTSDWAMAEMIKNPSVMKKAQQEVRDVFRKRGKVDEEGVNDMTYLKCVVKETLRLHPPAGFFPKECREKCEIDGYEIPANSRILVNVWAIGRDPKYWTDPESFVPERFLESSTDFTGKDFEFIPFGGGRRICPGLPLGITNVEAHIAFLLYHFDWKLPNGMDRHDLDMTEVAGLAVKRKHELHLIPMAYDLSTNGKISRN